VKLLFICGALRRDGSTEGVIKNSIATLSSRFKDVKTDVVYLCDYRITVCDSCYTCDEKRQCWMPDDVTFIVKKMLVADGIIYALPVNAFGVNSLMQIFLERAGVGCLRFSRPLENKAAGILITGRRYAHEMAWSQIALNIVLNRMILIGSGFPSLVKNDGKVLGNQIEDKEGAASAEAMLVKMVWFLRKSSYT
jgi:multimeric flavodoxin WrbA